jgi:hypothetical protein
LSTQLRAVGQISLSVFSACGGFSIFVRERARSLKRIFALSHSSDDINYVKHTEISMRYFIGSTAFVLLFSAAIIGCSDTSDTAAPPASVDASEATPVNFANAKCPIMGGKPTAELTTDYEGKTIGFCCDGCPEKWETLSDDEKAEKFAKVDAHAGQDHADGGHSNSVHSGE